MTRRPSTPPLPSSLGHHQPWTVAGHMGRRALSLLPLLAVTLLLGMALYHWQEGLDWAWESFSDYLDALERKPHDIDFGAQLPHAALRVYVMGERA